MSLQSIGPFQLLEELGRGGMGVVFRGFDPAISRPVAIKIIRADPLASAEESTEARLRFSREAAAAGKLSHPNIVTVYHLGEEGELQYLVLELVNGSSLEKILSNSQPQDQKSAASILTQVADALDYAHGEGIVHRDIKPANILVRPDGRAKITDFGIARIASQTMTKTGFTFGTPAYMSPEQILSAKVTGKADQYSLGVIAYQMLSGRKPFEAETGPALMLQIMMQEAPALHTVNPSISPRTSEVIAKAIAKKPEDRFRTCVDSAAQLAESFQAANGLARETLRESAAIISPIVRPIGVGVRPPPPVREEHQESPIRIPTRTATGPKVAQPEPVNPQLRPGDTKVNPKDGLTYVWIPPGTFRMGASPGDNEAFDDEKPARQVTITKGFWIGQTPMTQEAWQRVMGNNPSRFKGTRLPVESISWDDAKRYGGAVGMQLLTEAEWEYAARAGTTASRYGPLDKIAWYDQNSGDKTHEVGVQQPNAWGLYDMLGNVWEWVADWGCAYSPNNATDPQGPTSGTYRVIRGGSWINNVRRARASDRLWYEPASQYNSFGCRVGGISSRGGFGANAKVAALR